MKAADSLSQIYNTSGGSDISHYASHADSGEKLRLKAEWYQECIVLPFETITVTAPAGYDDEFERGGKYIYTRFSTKSRLCSRIK